MTKIVIASTPNIILAKIAENCVYARWTESEPGFCDRFVFEVLHAPYFGAMEKYRSHKNARSSGKLWQKSPYVIPDPSKTLAGDVCYWLTGSGGDGHAAIRALGNRYAENSIVHNHPTRGGKGFRPLSALRVPDVVLRLPMLGA